MSTKTQITVGTYEVPWWIRLLCWFGIYFLVELPLWPYRSEILSFPMGLLMPVVLISNPFLATYWVLNSCTIAATYLLYGTHLALTLAVRRKKTFRILLWLLIALVVFNLWGCDMSHHIG